MTGRPAHCAVLILAVTLPLKGCGASVVPSPEAAGQPTGGLAEPAISVSSIIPKGEEIVGTPTELYTRIARGALNCWFGASGPLKGGYIYHAQADSPSRGGKSEIVIHVRDTGAKDPRSVRAFRIGIRPGEVKSVVDIENYKIPEPLATHLTTDVRRWAGDEEGCSPPPAAETWAPAAKAPKSDKDVDKKKKTGKSAKKPAKPAPAKPAAKANAAQGKTAPAPK